MGRGEKEGGRGDMKVEGQSEDYVSLACEMLLLLKGVGGFDDDAVKNKLVTCMVTAVQHVHVSGCLLTTFNYVTMFNLI